MALVSRDARIVVKLPDRQAQDALLALAGAECWSIGKKAPMRAWIQLPESMHDDLEALEAWLRRAVAGAATRERRPKARSPRRRSRQQ